MDLIVAVYDNWGIGCCGTQPVALSEDRKFFRQTTKGAMVITGRKTLEDFPGGKPLPGRHNVVLSRQNIAPEGFTVCHSPAEVLALAAQAQRTFVIGGGSVYAQMLPYCQNAYVTKVHTSVECDTYFPNLDEDPHWELSEILQSGQEDGIAYEMCLYRRKG